MATKAPYSASTEDLLLVVWFLDFHEISESPKKIAKPITLLLISKHHVQSLSERALSCKSKEE